MEGEGWEKIGPKKQVKGQQAKQLSVVGCWLMQGEEADEKHIPSCGQNFQLVQSWRLVVHSGPACCKFNGRFIVHTLYYSISPKSHLVSECCRICVSIPTKCYSQAEIKPSPKVSVNVFHAFNIRQPSLSVTCMWPKTHVETFR